MLVEWFFTAVFLGWRRQRRQRYQTSEVVFADASLHQSILKTDVDVFRVTQH